MEYLDSFSWKQSYMNNWGRIFSCFIAWHLKPTYYFKERTEVAFCRDKILEFDFFLFFSVLFHLCCCSSVSVLLSKFFPSCFLLGCKQNGTKLGDVILPPWAKGDPREFIRVHREVIWILMMTVENVCWDFPLHINLSWICAVTGQSVSSGLVPDCCQGL